MLSDLKHTQEVPTKIFRDNKSTITLTKNSNLHGSSKHIESKFHYIHELIKNKDINYAWVLFLLKSMGMIKFEEFGLRNAI